MTVPDLIAGMLREEGGFQKALRDILDDELRMSLNEFCQISGISQSTMYKLLEDKREPNLRTVRQVIKALKVIMKADDQRFIAVIAFTNVMENLPKSVDFDGMEVHVREYPVSTLEDAIIAAVRAERDGALGVVCAPIVAPTVEKILSIPVSTVIPKNSVILAMDRLLSSIRSEAGRAFLAQHRQEVGGLGHPVSPHRPSPVFSEHVGVVRPDVLHEVGRILGGLRPSPVAQERRSVYRDIEGADPSEGDQPV
jgi:predicted transcriptional regulator